MEGAWAYRYLPKVSRQIQVRQESLPQEIRDIAWKAQLRLCKRFRRLVAHGKHPNVAVTAIARGLVAFLWARRPWWLRRVSAAARRKSHGNRSSRAFG